MPDLQSHEAWIEEMQRVSVDAARKAVAEYRTKLLADQVNKARSVVREYSSKDGGSGIIRLVPRTNNTVRIHTLLAVVGTGSGTITIQLADDLLIFPQSPPGGYLFFDSLDFFLGRGDIRQLSIATPGNPIFFGLWGEQTGDAQAIG